MVGAEADELIDTIPAPVPRSPYSSGIQTILEQTSGRADRRSTKRFRADVAQWQEECREALEDAVTEFLRHTLDHGTFVIRNESDRYLENVRVQVSFPPDVTVLMASKTNYCDHGGQVQAAPDAARATGQVRGLETLRTRLQRADHAQSRSHA